MWPVELARQTQLCSYVSHERLPVGQLQHMQVAMLASLPTLDYNRGLVDAALRQVVRVQRGVGGHSARTPLEVIRV